MNRDDTWAAIHRERQRLALDLADVPADRWSTPSLCAEWTVQETLAHLTAAALIGRARWLRSVLGARFNFGLHNERRLQEQIGDTPAETLAGFRAACSSTAAPSRDHWAWLGEVVVHGEDIRRPLRIANPTPIPVLTEVAERFALKDFTVPSKKTITGLTVRATDGEFHTGAGPEVVGSTLALVMAMAGRGEYLAELNGAGVSVLSERFGA